MNVILIATEASNVAIQVTRAIHLHSPGHHLITSWGQEENFSGQRKSVT